MKRILAIVLLLQVALVSYCHAYVPDSNRWQWFMNGHWYDKQHIEFYYGDSFEHRGHRMAETWILSAPTGKSTYKEGHGIFDLDCKGYWFFSTYVYDANTRKRIQVLNDAHRGFIPAKQGTYGMRYVKAMEEAWRKHESRQPRNSSGYHSIPATPAHRLSDTRM